MCVQPDNILIDHNYTCKIGDFGLATELQDTYASISSFSGTLAFLSPERVCNEQHSYPADIWSLGMTLVHAAAGGRGPVGQSTEAEEARKKAVEQGLDVFAIVGQRDAVQQLKQANEHNPSHPCYSVYPWPPSFETALLPPSVSAVYQSPELLSFLAACLQISPKQRWTAAQLLEHPFITAAERTPESNSNSALPSSQVRGMWSLPAGSRSTSLSDLTAMCEILCDKYTLCNDRSHPLPGECECIVHLDEARLTWLCTQLGLQEVEVQDEWTRAQQRWKEGKRSERAEKELRQKRMGEQRLRARAQSSFQLLSTAGLQSMSGFGLPSPIMPPDMPPPMHSQSFRLNILRA